MQIRPAPGTDDHNYGQLVKLLREKGYVGRLYARQVVHSPSWQYAIAGWDNEGKGRPTTKLLIAPIAQGVLIGAAFPISGMPDLPKPRLPQLNPAMRQAILNMLPPHIQSLPEPQLSQAIIRIFMSQQHRLQAMQGGGVPLPNAAAIPQQQHHQQQQQQQQQQYQQQQQQQTFSSSYLSDKLWNDHRSQAQYPAHHQMIQQQSPSRSLFPSPESLHQQQQPQQYHQPTLSVNTGVGIGVDLNNDVVGKSGIRGMAIKTKVANAKASARVKVSSNGHSHSHSHSHSNGNGMASPAHSSNSTHDSPTSVPGNGSPIPVPSPSSPSHSLSQSPHHDSRSGSRSGSESGSAAASPSYELHSTTTQGDYAVPRRGGSGGMNHPGFMELAGMGLAPGMNMSGGGMNMGVAGVNMGGMPGMTYGGPGPANSNAMMMMMMWHCFCFLFCSLLSFWLGSLSLRPPSPLISLLDRLPFI